MVWARAKIAKTPQFLTGIFLEGASTVGAEWLKTLIVKKTAQSLDYRKTQTNQNGGIYESKSIICLNGIDECHGL
jgi:hypothetical protein